MIEIQPKERIDAVVTAPGSKSITNRALAAAALAEGRSKLHNILISDDTRYMLEALETIGIEASPQADGTIAVRGCGGNPPAGPARIYIGNAGTAMRFLTAMLTLGRGTYTIDGNPRMRERPVGDLLDGLAQLGARATSINSNACPPVAVEGTGLTGGSATMPGNVSSQFFSAILLAAPYASSDTTISAQGELVSKPYVDMTIAMMREFGADAGREGNRMTVRAGKGYKATEYAVECDASSASYFFAAAAVTGGRVRVRGLSRNSIQGDVHFVDALAQMGCEICSGLDGAMPFIEVQGRPLKAIDIDMSDISDVSLTLAVTAVFAEGSTRIRNVANMRYKETDRIAALANELRRIGQEVEELPDGLVIHPRPVQPAVIHTYDDHRIAMSFALAGLRSPGIVISNPGCVSKTFPDFFDRFQAL